MEFPLDEIEEKKKEEYFKKTNKIGSVRFRYGWQLIEAWCQCALTPIPTATVWAALRHIKIPAIFSLFFFAFKKKGHVIPVEK